MKPAPFKYIAVDNEPQLAELLTQYGDEASILAGGQSLVPMMNFRIVTPAVLIDVNAITAMKTFNANGNVVEIGALTRHAAIEDSKSAADRLPLLRQAIRHVAHRAVRNRGTLGGSLALAYPGAELPLVTVALGGEISLASSRGERRLPAEDFITGALDTSLADDEYIRSVHIPAPPSSGSSFVETSRRHGDFAIAAASAVIAVDPAGRITFARLGVAGGTGAPIRLHQAEQELMRNADAASQPDALVNDAIADLEVFGDHHYPADYRRHVLRGVLRRAVTQARAEAEARHVH